MLNSALATLHKGAPNSLGTALGNNVRIQEEEKRENWRGIDFQSKSRSEFIRLVITQELRLQVRLR